jgi:predicted dehydrogenase
VNGEPPSISRPLRLGIVGGARILPAHLRGIAQLQDAGVDAYVVTALCSRRIEDALMFVAPGQGPAPRRPTSTNPRDPLAAPHRYVSDLQHGVVPEVFEHWKELLESDSTDAVLVLAPVGLHHQVALDALRAGKHVLIEKPLAISVRAGKAIADEAARRGLVAGVAESARYTETTRALRWVLDEGLIGSPQLWLSAGIGGEWAPDRIVAHTPWRHRKLEAGGGPAIDLGVHLMHQIRYLMGPVDEIGAVAATMEPTRVDDDAATAVANELEDVFLSQLRFASGAVGTAIAGWAGRGERSGLDANPVIYGTRGCIKGDDVIADGARRSASERLGSDSTQEVRDRFFPYGVRDPFALELLDFARACAGGWEMEASASQGVLDLAMAYSILESSRLSAPVRVDDVLSGAVAGYQAEIDEFYEL